MHSEFKLSKMIGIYLILMIIGYINRWKQFKGLLQISMCIWKKKRYRRGMVSHLKSLELIKGRQINVDSHLNEIYRIKKGFLEILGR